MTGTEHWEAGAAGAGVYAGRVFMVRHTYGHKTGRWALPDIIMTYPQVQPPAGSEPVGGSARSEACIHPFR